MNSTTTRATDVKVGDQITELDTPEGPYYTVVKVNRASLVVDASDEYGPLEIRIPISPNSGVRVAG